MKYPILSGDISVYIIILSAFLLIAVNLLIASCYIFVRYKNKYSANLFKAREEARLATENKNLVLSNVSRLIRNRMIRVVGMNELIFRESTDNITKERTSEIRSFVDDILALMQGVQDYSMLERNLFDVVADEFDLSTLLIDSVTKTAPLYKANDLVLDLSVDKELPRKIYGDSYKLRRCLVYLLYFACKKNNDGSVKLSATQDKTDGERREISFNLHVTGLDISLSKVDYLLSYDSSVNDMIFQHNDLDLLDIYLAARYLKILGTELEIANPEKDVFDISFTLKTKVSGSEVIGDIRSSFRKGSLRRDDFGMKFKADGVKALFIDEKEASFSYVRELLKDTGVLLDLALTAGEGASKLIKNEYDLIFLNDSMKNDDGDFLIDKIRDGGISMANSHVPCIAVTSDIKFSISESKSHKKYDSFLLNPIGPEELEKVFIDLIPSSKIEVISDIGMFPGIRSVEDIRKYSEGYEDLYENAVKIYKRSKAYKE
ncbi:MAG: hybrid sensor histidine kinase/response regulator [Lachnospiraceae bacterium]|nr:hybrid sensor histidine kinase/response regulator [Lachnospiraceae bacterium]